MRSIRKSRKRTALIIVSVLVTVCVVGGIVWRSAISHTETNTNTQRISPPFQSVLPKDSSIDSLGGWQKLTPPNGDASYVFVDSLKGTKIRVSQQVVPQGLKEDAARQAAQPEQNYRTLEAGQTKVYVGTSAQGPQSVILSKNGLLILIKSEAVISDDAWISYINALQ